LFYFIKFYNFIVLLFYFIKNNFEYIILVIIMLIILSSISFLKIFRIKNNHTSIYGCCIFSEKSRVRGEEEESSIDATHLRCTFLNIIVSKRAGLAIFLSVINFEIKRGVVSYDKS